MNRKQRKKLRRKLKRSTSVAKSFTSASRQSGKGQEAQANPEGLLGKEKRILKRLPGLFWALLSGVVVLLSLYELRPKISIEPYASKDLKNPFAEQFYVQNNSIYAIDVQPSCTIKELRVDTFSATGPSLVRTAEAKHLSPGARTNATCDLFHFVKLAGETHKFHQLSIAMVVKSKLPLGISVCTADDFWGQSASDGTFIWTYQGSEKCPKS
jgi:hypothetical protein